MTMKKEIRKEKKLKKLTALSEIMKLNNQVNSQSEGDMYNGINTTQYKPNDNIFQDLNEEPKNKKAKIFRCKESDDPAANEKLNLLQSTNEESNINKKNEIIALKKQMHVPKIRFKDIAECATLSVKPKERIPLFLTDIQHLLMFVLLGNESPYRPNRWCQIERVSKIINTAVLIIDGISFSTYLEHQNLFVETNKILKKNFQIVLPVGDAKIAEELSTIPMTSAQIEELLKTHESLEEAIKFNKDPTIMVKSVFPMESNSNLKISESTLENNLPKLNQLSRTQLLLSALQMVDEGYPMPLQGELACRYKNYKFTKDKYEPVTSTSPMFGLDCEMCLTSARRSELTRISIVNEKLEVVYESLVRPNNKIVDYLTPYSGITPEMLLNVTKSIEEVQNDIRKLLPQDAILVGQSLNCDLNAMQMMHPYIIDTSVIFNTTGTRKKKTKLQILAKEFLGEDIQCRKGGHDSIEDSSTSLKLAQLKLLKGLEFGDVILTKRKNQIRSYNNLQNEKTKTLCNNLFVQIKNHEKTSAILTSKDFNVCNNKIYNMSSNYEKNMNFKYMKMDSNKAVIKKARDIIIENTFTLVNVNLDSDNIEISNQIEKSISKADKWIKKLWDSIPNNGLFVVILGNSTSAPNTGVLMLQTKKNVNCSSKIN